MGLLLTATPKSQTGRAATLVVAASGSSAVARTQADYVCSGTADDVLIQAAIAALPTVGGTVHLAAGTYNLAAALSITGTGVTLEGEGKEATRLVGGAALTKVVSIDGGGSSIHSVGLRNLKLDMTAMADAGTSYGLYMHNVYGCEVRNILITPQGTGGHSLWSMYLADGVLTSTFDNLAFTTLKIQGTALSNATTLTFINCDFDQATIDQAEYLVFVQPTMQQGYTNRFALSNLSGLTIIGGDIEGTYTNYLNFGASCSNILSLNNVLTGTFTNYYTGTLPTNCVLSDANLLLGTLTDGMTAGGSLAIAKDLAHRGTKVGFYNVTPIVRATLATGAGHTVDDVITALQNLGLVKQA